MLGAVVLTCAAPIVLAAAQQREPAKAPPKPITLTGCVQRGESAADEYTLAEKKDSQIYRLTGTDLRDYVGPARCRSSAGCRRTACGLSVA